MRVTGDMDVMQRLCRSNGGCYYYGGWCCDYMLMTGRRRPCPPGAECTVKRKNTLTPKERQVIFLEGMGFPSVRCVEREESKCVSTEGCLPVTDAKPLDFLR